MWKQNLLPVLWKSVLHQTAVSSQALRVKLVLELAGIKDVTAKILSGSKNKLNIARATVKALSQLKK